jgi:multidrug efflux system membrane fusion protein
MIMSHSINASLRNALLGTVAGAAALAIAPSQSTHAESGAQPAPAAAVSVAIVEPRDTTTWDEFSGRLEAVERVDVRPRVAGAVQEIHFREGALVKQGDLLMTIDPAPYAAEVDRNEAQVAAAEARVNFTKSEVERARQLSGTPALSVRELDTRTNTYNEAVANLRAAKAALETARLNLGYTAVRAPVAGRVGRIEITVGNLVAAGPGAPVLTRLVSVDPIYASFNADEDVVTRALATLSPKANAAAEIGQIPVQMATAAREGEWINGRLQLIDNQVDASSGTVRVRAIFSNPEGRLMAGQFAKVRMAQPKGAPALVVNERAIGTDQNKKFVMVVGDGNKTAYREVTLGALADRLRIVTSGLTAGERIIVNGLQRVRPGDVVAPETVAMDGTSDAHARIETGSTVAQQ